MNGTTVEDVSWEGEGCSISQASTSIMTDLVIGHDIDEALTLQQQFLTLMQSRGHEDVLDEAAAESLDDAIAFAGVAKYPARVKCALLGWMAMKSAIAEAGTADDTVLDDTVLDEPCSAKEKRDDRGNDRDAVQG